MKENPIPGFALFAVLMQLGNPLVLLFGSLAAILGGIAWNQSLKSEGEEAYWACVEAGRTGETPMQVIRRWEAQKAASRATVKTAKGGIR